MNIFSNNGPEMIRNEILKNTRDCLITDNRPVGVYISGGIDSTIVMSHVADLGKIYGIKVIAYTADFGLKDNECELQHDIAENYGVDFVIVKTDGMYKRLNEIEAIFNKPRFNIWPYFMAEAAKMDGCSKVFLGEGADEVFGGYDKKSYLEAWADSIIYIQSTYKITHDHFGIDICAPFLMLDWQQYLPLHKNPQKRALRVAYKDHFPEFINKRVKSEPPVYANYMLLWEKEFKNNVDIKQQPKTDIEARDLIHLEVTRIWVEERTRRLVEA